MIMSFRDGRNGARLAILMAIRCHGYFKNPRMCFKMLHAAAFVTF